MKKIISYLAIPAIVLGIVIAWSALPGCSKADASKAESAARDYAKNIPGSTGNVSCTQSDSDGDGYVTCSIFREKGEAVVVECGAETWCACNCARGCKPVETIKLRGGRR